ncbi:MAG: hypothetical protein IJA62_07895 [Ruminococcus sp.]|nr:hypothetical protein [Ruminococcus sp.]
METPLIREMSCSGRDFVVLAEELSALLTKGFAVFAKELLSVCDTEGVKYSKVKTK